MIYAGFWKRFIASVIDSMLLTVVFNFLTWFILPWSWKNNQFFLGLVSTMIIWLYFTLLESSIKQGTLGKIVLGLKIIDYNNQRISFLRANTRFFSKYISAIIFMIGFIMIIFTSRKQGLHDIIAKTLVVKN